ncbi:MAG TPA: RNA polymerase factor sigma-32 [Candidatus Binatus sp.]|uniref:RNA polymerase factor sigma-32 n=1 Tax=Candidatus Binatus sp. TaxID=2811406 RepID=UPI002B46F652|nr:RNA polymerase factor sigma-32 [Candidatus Binatus sp.]HKN12381.1 RNA polymerase factor sigma-32 [Candidatus Binatus sp.]
MARKPGKPIRPKRATKAKRAGKAGGEARRGRAIAEPLVAEDSELELGAEAGIGGEVAPEDAAIEVSEFRPVESTDEEAAAESEQDIAEAKAAKESSALVATDPLGRYLTEIRRFPLLSREEEAVIARRYVRDKDPEDAYRLVTANLRLVVKLAFEFARATKNVLDLIQEGNVGLMEAVKNFDPEHGIRFPSYAVWWVRAYIYRYLINNWRLVKIGTTQAQRKLFFNLRKETERLEREGFKPQPLLLAHRMGVRESDVREMQERMGQSEVSLDQPTGAGDDNDTRLLDVIPDAGHNPETETADREWRDFAHDKVEQFAATLAGKELEIFKARLLAEDPETLQVIGARFGISRERVRQIETRLKRRLKEFIEASAPDVGPS